jgi:hypothetical protein
MTDLEDFVWPCDKRTAHGPHTLTTVLTNPPPECPGVAAHPLTQIGKGDLPLRRKPSHD